MDFENGNLKWLKTSTPAVHVEQLWLARSLQWLLSGLTRIIYVVYPSDLTIVIWVQSDLLALAQVQHHLHLLRSLSVPVGLGKMHIFVLFKGGNINSYHVSDGNLIY